MTRRCVFVTCAGSRRRGQDRRLGDRIYRQIDGLLRRNTGGAALAGRRRDGEANLRVSSSAACKGRPVRHAGIELGLVE